MSQVQTRTVRKKAGSVSLSAEFLTLHSIRGSGRNTRQPPMKAYEVGYVWKVHYARTQGNPVTKFFEFW